MTYRRDRCRQPDHDRSADYGTVQFVDIGLISASQQRIDSIIVVAVLRRTVNQPLTQYMSQAIEVIRQCGSQLLLTNRPVSNTSFFTAARLLPRLAMPTCRPETQSYFAPALFDTFTLAQYSHTTSAEQNIVHVLFQHGVDDIFDFD